MKLLLQGETENSGGDDPFPLPLPGEAKPVLSSDVEKYVNEELFFYYRFYLDCKHSGPPFGGGWTEWPPWACQLLRHFDSAVEAVRRHNELQAYRHAAERGT